MGGVLAALAAELAQLHPVRVVAPVLLRDVVAVLTFDARHGDLGAHVLLLAGHGVDLSFRCTETSCQASTHKDTRGPRGTQIAPVARAGLEPATPRL